MSMWSRVVAGNRRYLLVSRKIGQLWETRSYDYRPRLRRYAKHFHAGPGLETPILTSEIH